MQQLQEHLTGAKTQFLEQQCLLSELRDMVNCLQADNNQQKDQECQSQLSHSAQTPCSAVLESLSKHLQAALLTQHLRLPAVEAQQQNPLSTVHGELPDSSAGQRSELLGTMQHFLGVPPQQLRQAFLPSRKAAQRTHTPVLPILEDRIKQHAQAATAAITGSPPDEAAVASEVVQKVKDTAAEVAQRAQDNMQQLQQLHTDAAAYVQDLDNIHAVLQQLVGQCMLQEQPKIVQATREYNAATIHSSVSKLHLMQQQLWADTYSADNMQALAAISRELQEEEQELCQHIEQAEAALGEYGQLGEDFEGVVQQYATTKGELKWLDGLLLTLTEVEDQFQMGDASRY